MYHAHFGLNQSPFSITPNPDFFYSGSKRGDILAALLYAVTHGEGIIKVTGEVGSGKTMLCRMLEGLMPEHVEVIYLVNPTLSREEVMFTIAGELEIQTESKRPDEVIRLLHQDLIAKHIQGKQVVLLVEEAQAMSLETLEEIRLFSNLETAKHKLLQIVLFGQPELDQNLNLPAMRQLKERITHSFTVPPLAPDLMSDFLMFRLRTAGYHGPDLFTKGAIKLLSSVSKGIVRRVNILADKALLAAFSENKHAVEVAHMEAAISDSEFIDPVKHVEWRKLLLPMSLGLVGLALVIDIGLRIQEVQRHESSSIVVDAKGSSPASNPKVAKVPAVLPVADAANASASTSVANKSEATLVAGQQPVVTLSEKLETKPVASAIDLGRTQGTKWQKGEISRERISASKRWLQESPDERFTIQIAVLDADDKEKIEQFLKKASAEIDISQLFLYPTRIGGTARFGVVYASYDSRTEAKKKRSELDQQGKYQGQVRTLIGLRNEIAHFQSNDLW